MTYQKEAIVYRIQSELANENGIPIDEVFQACYHEIMVDSESGDRIPTNKRGITTIPLGEYPELQETLENLNTLLDIAFKAEYQKELDNLALARQAAIDNELLGEANAAN